jgi:pyruvate/2-oxoglutarate/acetoin dehydrogenase E1 component/TPP-dependent pyruvate/acetoin dehydrogenase alpha subunit
MKEQIYSLIEKYVDVEDDYSQYKRELISDYITALVSREVSINARKEVLNGKAKFGISGDGKEIPQIAMAKVFRKGDWKAGYYRDQTFMFAKNIATVADYFAQLYSDSSNDPFSGGRQMNCHFATPTVDGDGNFLNLKELHNVSSDISCTAGQVARAIGHAFASKVFRSFEDQSQFGDLTDNGNEVCFFTIGEGSTSEGPFWEMMNAAGVLDIPLVAIVWDDGYSISVPVELQTTKSSISKALEGLLIDESGKGIHIYVAKAWDYQELCLVFQKAANIARKKHKAVLIHVQECTQPLGHSTSGSHERYKSKERLAWEAEYDCIAKMEEWLISNALLSNVDIDQIRSSTKEYVKEEVKKAWRNFNDPIKFVYEEIKTLLTEIKNKHPEYSDLSEEVSHFNKLVNPHFSEIHSTAKRIKFLLLKLGVTHAELNEFISKNEIRADIKYHTHLHSHTPKAALSIPAILPTYDESSAEETGYKIINKYFDHAFTKYPNLIAFGEDLGKIGDVNQGFAGLQTKHGDHRIMDTGIREWTIIGQALGSAMRGLKPIVEIQYLDYLAYAFSPLSDDLATLRFRSNGIQAAPMIVRTRGHRLEGVWHSGSPMGIILSGMRGIYLCVPRNFVQAAGMYNTLLKSDDPGIVIECLNAYRLKEQVPSNLAEITIPLGMAEILREGHDITVVTYGACVKICLQAAVLAEKMGIQIEVIDVQTLMPFDLEQTITYSLQKTNKILFVDEDVPGGATAYMMREVLEKQGGFKYLDSAPRCLSGAEHRTPFGSDGDYYSKPNVETVFEMVYEIMKDVDPNRFK